MKIFPKILQSALIITTPSLMAYQTVGEFPKLVTQEVSHKTFHIPDLQTLSYDQVVDLLALIESDGFEDNCSIDELDQINQFISFLAMEGATDNEMLDVANATASLYRNSDIKYALLTDSAFAYTTRPAIQLEGVRNILLCKGWFHKQWDNTKAFVKKHKKAIIIGTIVVVTVGVVIVAAVLISGAVAASTVAASGLATAGSLVATQDPSYEEKSYSEPVTSPIESLTASIQEEISTFKETIAQEQFAAVSELNGISIEQNGRIVGSLFAHKTMDSVTANVTQNPFTPIEMKDFGFNSQYPTPKWVETSPESCKIESHFSTDAVFSTDFATTYPTQGQNINMLSYQARGDLALSSECYTQAMQDFGNAIALDPSNPILYLERGIANFELGNYENSIADYSQYIEKKGEPFSVTDFSLGFAKGVPRGVYDSGTGALLFLSDFITHPIQTSKQVVDSLTQLAILVRNDEFGVVAEVLSPELHQLVTQWDSLSSETRGELAGYAVGKLGTDLIAPGAIAKVASKSVKSAKELVAIGKNVKMAQEILILETATGIGIPAKIADIVEMGKKTAALGEEIGLTTQEIGQLQQAGKLETTIAKAYDHLSPSMKESFELYDSAQKFLKPYKGFMAESQAKELIHQAGVRTFPRPQGIPDNFRVKITDKGAGMKYVHPTDEGTFIRVMPGKPHSPSPYQQKPYVCYQKHGNTLDKHGNIVDKEALQAHIPYEEFVYRE